MTAKERVFIDTNVPLYLLGSDAGKADIAEEIFRSAAFDRIISTQIVAEFVNVARRKTALSWPDIRRAASHLCAMCALEPVTTASLDAAIDLCEAHDFSWYDGIVIASALAAGASRLLSEDLQDGRKIGALTIVNPFAA
jgi:predicted nucleic acid-binding protein